MIDYFNLYIYTLYSITFLVLYCIIECITRPIFKKIASLLICMHHAYINISCLTLIKVTPAVADWPLSTNGVYATFLFVNQTRQFERKICEFAKLA